MKVIDPDGRCEASNFNSSSSSPCDSGYVFDLSVFPATLATDESLVCDSQWQEQLLGTLMMLGLLVGSVLGGWLSDRIGRKRTLLIAVLVMGPSILVKRKNGEH